MPVLCNAMKRKRQTNVLFSSVKSIVSFRVFFFEYSFQVSMSLWLTFGLSGNSQMVLIKWAHGTHNFIPFCSSFHIFRLYCFCAAFHVGCTQFFFFFDSHHFARPCFIYNIETNFCCSLCVWALHHHFSCIQWTRVERTMYVCLCACAYSHFPGFGCVVVTVVSNQLYDIFIIFSQTWWLSFHLFVERISSNIANTQ